jgi:hypothetical protein
MRFGIDFRMLAAGRAVVHRGMGRFTQQQLREVLRLPAAAAHEFVLLLPPVPAGAGGVAGAAGSAEAGGVADAGGADALLLPEIAAAANVSLVTLPPALAAATAPGAARDVLRHAAALSPSIADLEPRRATTPPRRSSPPSPASGAATARRSSPPTTISFRSSIPSTTTTASSATSICAPPRALPWADRLLAISRLQVAAKRPCSSASIAAASTSPIPSPSPGSGRSLAGVTAERLADSAGRRLHAAPLPTSSLLAVTHLHHAKNLLTLLRAFALMPDAWRRRHPLVVAGDFDLAGQLDQPRPAWLQRPRHPAPM